MAPEVQRPAVPGAHLAQTLGGIGALCSVFGTGLASTGFHRTNGGGFMCKVFRCLSDGLINYSNWQLCVKSFTG